VGQEHRRVDSGFTAGGAVVIAPFHHSMAGLWLLFACTVTAFALGVCVGVMLVMLG
jgi:hypothetical protein